MTKLNTNSIKTQNSKCDKTQIVTKFKNCESNKLKNSNCDKTQFGTKIKNSNSDKTKTKNRFWQYLILKIYIYNTSQEPRAKSVSSLTGL